LTQGGETTEVRHRDVEQRDVGLVLTCELHGLNAVGGLGDHSDVRDFVQQRAQAGAD